MRKVNIKGWEIEVDLEKTLEFYNKLDKDDLLTCCIFCKNYYYGIGKSSLKLIDFISNLGAIPEKTADVSLLTVLDNGKYLYDAYYLLCGNILVNPIEAENVLENEALVIIPTKLTDGISFYFTNKPPPCVRKDIFPQPMLALQVICEIPWVIDELPV